MNAPGRNDPCPCGSGRKYKHCCLGKAQAIAGGAAAVSPEAWHRLGLAAADQGRLDDAIAAYRKALALRPRSAEILYHLGQAYNQSGRKAEAVTVLEKAIALKPRFAPALNTLGMAFDGLGREAEAIDCYRKATAIDPGHFGAWFNLGSALLGAGAIDEAVPLLEQAVRLQPDQGILRGTLGNALLSQGEHGRATEHLLRAVQLSPGIELHMFLLNYLPVDSDYLFRAHRAYGERVEAPFRHRRVAYRNDRDPDRRLRIGYLSPDFRNHSVAFFIEPVLARHDRTQVEVHAYYTGVEDDAVTARIAASVDAWRPCAALGDEALCERIIDDGIDLLIDLAGHTRGGRLPVFARRPAPVQATWLGYPATTGLSAMDWRLVTADTDPPGAEAWHSERLWRLPRSLWCYRPDPAMPVVDPRTPARRHGHVRFLSANNIAKLSDAAIAVWSRLLAAVPGACLVISGIISEAARQSLRRRFAAHGIDPARIEIHGKLPAAEFHALLGDADIALDPWPYNGTTTSCDAMWMGLPLVTLTGERSAGRSGHALLRMIGLASLAARDEDDYLEIARALASDWSRLDALRASMRARIEASPLRDESGIARDLEAAYRGMWRNWCVS